MIQYAQGALAGNASIVPEQADVRGGRQIQICHRQRQYAVFYRGRRAKQLERLIFPAFQYAAFHLRLNMPSALMPLEHMS